MELSTPKCALNSPEKAHRLPARSCIPNSFNIVAKLKSGATSQLTEETELTGRSL